MADDSFVSEDIDLGHLRCSDRLFWPEGFNVAELTSLPSIDGEPLDLWAWQIPLLSPC